MAIISAAIAAISAAIATTTIATVTAAAVAVANVVAVVGLAVTAVGVITGNKSLLDAGKIMGYVGLGGNVAGFAVGSLAEGATNFASRMSSLYTKAWEDGVGGIFSSAKPGAPTGLVAENATAPAEGAMPASAPTSTQTGAVAPVTNAQTAATATPPVSPSAPGSSAPISSSSPSPAVATPQTPVAPQTPVTPNMSASQWGVPAATPNAATTAAPGNGLLNNPLIPLVAAQGVGGAAGGWFQGSATQAQTEIQKQQQAREAQQQQFVQRNSAYAPSISFDPYSGLLNTVHA